MSARPMRDEHASPVCTATGVFMDTVIGIEVVHADRGDRDCRPDLRRAFQWFRRVEICCSRFDPASELSRLGATPGTPVRVSAILFEALACALDIAVASDGAFDPTIGGAMLARGFDRDFRSGRRVARVPEPPRGTRPTYRDIHLDAAARTVTLARPLGLDLGAVAKGLAADLAAAELARFAGAAIDAGGDLLVRGHDRDGAPWAVGVQHPRRPGALLDLLRVADAAVCTSGDYERPAADGAGHHLLDPATGRSAGGGACVTVIAPSAMRADALATAAFVLGPERAIPFLERSDAEGIIVTPSLVRRETAGLAALPHPATGAAMGDAAPRAA